MDPDKDGNDSGVNVLLKGMTILTQASATKEHLSKGESEHLIENVLHQNLMSLNSWMTESSMSLLQPTMVTALKEALKGINNNSSTIDVRRVFSTLSILLLDSLTIFLNEGVDLKQRMNLQCDEASPKNPESENMCPILSVQQEKQVSACIQFVVVLGLCPYLSQGIGIPISERLGPGQILLATVNDTVTQFSETTRIQRLIPVLKVFVKMITCVYLRELVMNKFLSDIFVVLIQARHSAKLVLQELKTNDISSENTALKEKQADEMTGPTKNIPEKKISGPLVNAIEKICKDNDSSGIGDVRSTFEILEKTIHDCNVHLDQTIRTATVPLVLKEVLCLLGFAKSSQGTKCVPWFRRLMAGILRDVIMHPPGIQHMLTSFLVDLSTYDTKDWQNCKAIARIISHCPVNVKNVEQFYSSVCQQLLDLIHPRESSVPLAITKAVGAAIFELNTLQNELVHRVCLSHLITPLTECSLKCTTLSSKQPGAIVVSEDRLTTCILHCHRLFIIGQETQSPLCAKLESVLGVLFSLYLHVRRSASHLKGFVKDLIMGYLNCTDTKNAVLCLLDLLLSSSREGGLFPPIHSDFCLVSGPGGGVEAVVGKDKQTSIELWTHPASAIVDLLKSTKSDAVNSELFLALLQRLANIVVTETSTTGDIVLPTRAVSREVKATKLNELREKVVLVTLISAVGEEFGSSVIQNTSQILTFTKVTLDRCVAMCASSDDTDTRMFEWETATMSLGLLSAVLGMGCMFTDEDKAVLDSILPLLSALTQSETVESHIKDMASDLKVAVATRGLVSVNMSGDGKDQKSTKPENERKVEMMDNKQDKNLSKPLIEVLSSDTNGEGNMKSQAREAVENNDQVLIDKDSGKRTAMSGKDTKWSVAMREVEDPQIPVKGHGLIQLARMLEDREEGASNHSALLLGIFMDNLSNSDSYIYLASINGLSALSDLCHEEVILSLTSEFRSKCNDNQCSWETTCKVGEAIVKATRRLGEMAPKYRDVLLSAILFGCHHDNSFVKASCLSGLADICKLLRFSISPVIQEVLMCCRLILTSDPDVDPRRAAALTLSCLLQGLGKDTLTVLGRELSELYRTLKHASESDTDEKVKVHAQLALQELDGIMKAFLFPPQHLKHTIKILGYQ